MTPDYDRTRSVPTDDPTRTVERVKDLSTVIPESAAAVAPVHAPPGFTVERELGVGGMGVVYLARQAGLNRPVALKVVKGGTKVDGKALIRFLAEAEAVAAIRHPNVVEVYQYGEHAGQPYMALEFCPGGDLTALSKGEQTRDADWFRRVADLMAQVADGVNAAHAQGIVHRDLKPANVLLANSPGEPAASAAWVPKVADFGLAKRGIGSDLTNTEAVMGTPAYMAPEQAGGGTKFVGPEADVWALGVMLYELACGERPIDTSGPVMVAIARVVHGEVSQLRTKVPAISPDLALIVHKCLSRDPRDRYPTAAGLANDLRNWLDGQPISVRTTGVVEQAVKWVRRKPALATAYAGSVAAVFLLFFVFVLGMLWQQAENAKRLATEAQADAEREREKVARVEYGRTMQVAHQAWAENNAAESVALLACTDPRFRGWEWDYLHRLCNGQVLEVKHVYAADMSTDGTRLATVGPTGVTIWAVPTGEKLLELPAANHVMFSEDGRRLLTAGHDKVARVWELPAGRELSKIVSPHGTHALLTLDGKRVLRMDLQSVVMWDATTGEKLAELGGHEPYVEEVVVNHDGSRAVTKSQGEKQWRLWDLTGVPKAQPLDGHTNNIKHAAFSPDGKTLLTVDWGGKSLLRDLEVNATQDVSDPNGDGHGKNAVALGSRGTRVAWIGYDGTLRLWETGHGMRWKSDLRHTDSTFRLALSPDEKVLATGSNDMTVRVWDAQTGKETHLLKGHTRPIDRVVIGNDSSTVLTVAQSESAYNARVWDLRVASALSSFELKVKTDRGCDIEWAGRRLTVRVHEIDNGIGWDMPHPPLAQGEEPEGVTLSSNGERAAVAFKNGRVLLWDRTANRAITTLTADIASRPLLAFSHDGSKLFSSAKTAGQVWDANTGAALGSLSQNENTTLSSAVFSPDGTRIATGSHDSTAHIHDATSGAMIAEMKGHTSSVMHLAFHPNGKHLATASNDRSVRLWDVNSGKQLALMKGHTGEITSLAFHPSGVRLVTGAKDRTVRVWDIVSGAEVFTHKESKAALWGILARFSDDGKQLLTSTDGINFKVLDSTPVARTPPAR